MGKAYSKAAKRRAKKAAAFPALAAVPQREADGRQKRSRDPDYERDPSIMALRVRARHMGLPEGRAADMRRQIFGDEAGKALSLLLIEDDAVRLWHHFGAITAAEAKYHRTLGKSIHPKTAKIEMMVDTFEARADDVIDIRSQDEKDIARTSNWMKWQGLIDRLPMAKRTAIYDAYRRHVPLVDTGKVRPAGVRLVEALKALDAAM